MHGTLVEAMRGAEMPRGDLLVITLSLSLLVLQLLVLTVMLTRGEGLLGELQGDSIELCVLSVAMLRGLLGEVEGGSAEVGELRAMLMSSTSSVLVLFSE